LTFDFLKRQAYEGFSIGTMFLGRFGVGIYFLPSSTASTV